VSADLILICRQCRFPIEGDAGYLRVTYADINKHQQQEQEYRARHPEGSAVSLEDFLLYPDPVHWLACHDPCEPEPGVDAYQIDAARFRTWRDVCGWTAHLMEKNWFAATDWDNLLRELAGETEATTVKVLARSA
jgi:hypothetical protein